MAAPSRRCWRQFVHDFLSVEVDRAVVRHKAKLKQANDQSYAKGNANAAGLLKTEIEVCKNDLAAVRVRGNEFLDMLQTRVLYVREENYRPSILSKSKNLGRGSLPLSFQIRNNNPMSTIETKGMPELMAELQEAVDQASKGHRDPEAMQHAVESLNRRREEIGQRTGLLDIAVPSLRELRQ